MFGVCSICLYVGVIKMNDKKQEKMKKQVYYVIMDETS